MQNVQGVSEDIIGYFAIVIRICENFLLNNWSTDNFKHFEDHKEGFLVFF